MEQEFIHQNSNKYIDSKFYSRLIEFTPADFDYRLDELVKVARSSKPEEILNIAGALSTFVCNEELSCVNDKIVHTIVDGLFFILEHRDTFEVKELLAGDYRDLTQNLEMAKNKVDFETAFKIEELYEKEFYPTSDTVLDN